MGIINRFDFCEESVKKAISNNICVSCEKSVLIKQPFGIGYDSNVIFDEFARVMYTETGVCSVCYENSYK